MRGVVVCLGWGGVVCRDEWMSGCGDGWQHPTGGSGTALGTTPPGAAAGMGTTLADRDLPSVMTCANYLKLPPYSCKVSEGGGEGCVGRALDGLRGWRR